MSRSEMVNELHVPESLPAYALGILEGEEARAVREHLSGCHACRQELEAFQKVADRLPLAVPEASPSRDLRPRLLERVEHLEAKTPARSAGWNFPARLLPVGALAGVALILLLAVSNVLLWQRLNRAPVLTGPLGMRAIALQNTTAAPASSGIVIMGADGQNGVLVVDKLPVLDAAHEYQAWLVSNSKQVAGPVFSVDETGYRGMRLQAPENLLTYSELWVTIEPVGGSPEPTGERVLNGPLFNP